LIVTLALRDKSREAIREMKKLILLTVLMSGACAPADVRFIWLLTLKSVPRLPQVSDAPQYGVQVFLDSDNAAVTEFQITTVV
jgi:hypothetical protein